MNQNVLTFRIESTRPLLMQAETLANPLSPVTRSHKAVAGKRKKTEDDYLWLLRSEWDASMYYDDEAGPYLPSINIEACIAEAAKASKQGKVVKQAVHVVSKTGVLPLEYEGPRSKDELYATPKFVDVRGVNVGGKKVMRARPQFTDWACEFSLAYMDDMIDPTDLVRIVEHAGRAIGVGTYRPRFGRFTARAIA